MKKKILALIATTVMIITLSACSEAEQATAEPVQPEQTADESEPEEIENEEDETTVFLRSLYGQYGAYLEEGYDADTDTFISPITGRPYYSPYFTLADANGDNYDDLIVTGNLGLRDAKVSEIMFYDDNEMAFYINMFSGCVDYLSEGCVIISNEDRDISNPIYYDDTVVYKLTPSADEISEATRILAHFNVINEEGDAAVETHTYYSGDTEISEEEYTEQYAKYEAAIIPIDTYEEMSVENIAAAIPKF